MIQLVVFDLDGTLTGHHSVWQCIHERLGTWEGRGEIHLRDYVDGKIDYADFARLDAAEWKDVPLEKIREIVDEIPIVDGAKELVQDLGKLGVKTVIISSGLDILAERVAQALGIDEYFSNKLEVENGKLTGEVEVIVAADGKGEFFERLLQERNVAPEETIAIGDGPSDVPLFKISAVSFAVNNAPKEVGAQATYHVQSLRDIRDRLKAVIRTEH